MNTRQLEHGYQSGGAYQPRKWGSVDFTLVMIGLAVGWALLIGYPEPQAREVWDGAVSQVAPAKTPALPALSPDAIEHQAPTF